MAITGGRFLRPGRPSAGPAIATIETDAIHGDVVDHRLVVDIGDVRGTDVDHLAVVVHMAALPVAALIARTGVAKTIVHTAVESDMRSPISRVPQVGAASEAPVAGCP